jgi:hypothetical protein
MVGLANQGCWDGGGHVASRREIRNVYKILVRKLQVKRSVMNSRCRWEDNIKIDPKKV